MNAFRLIAVSNNLGDSKSLATHPATTTHMRIGAEERAKLGITDGVIRLSVGLEDVEDLKDDLAQALARSLRDRARCGMMRHGRCRAMPPSGQRRRFADRPGTNRSCHGRGLLEDHPRRPRLRPVLLSGRPVASRTRAISSGPTACRSRTRAASRCSCCAAPGRSPTRAAARSMCTAPAWSASSRCSSRARASNTPPARRWTRRPGFMVGAYHMVVPSSGENFDVAIPAFSLDSPHQSGRVH